MRTEQEVRDDMISCRAHMESNIEHFAKNFKNLSFDEMREFSWSLLSDLETIDTILMVLGEGKYAARKSD